MPMTSTKNFRLSSGLGVNNSMWPRWARSKIGSGVIGSLSRRVGKAQRAHQFKPHGGHGATRLCPTLQLRRPRHVVEQLVRAERARNEFLLRRVIDDQLQRTLHLASVKTRRSG